MSTTHSSRRSPRVPREIPELVDALRRHVELLRDFSLRAFRDHDKKYLGEVAAKLRLLVYKRARNKPLLLTLMDAFASGIRITLSGPSQFAVAPGIHGGDEVSLRQFLELGAFGVQTTQGFVMLSKTDFIGIWAQQHGAAHEDWEINEEFAIMRDSGVFLAGRQALEGTLVPIVETVLRIADEFLATLTAELVAWAAADHLL